MCCFCFTCFADTNHAFFSFIKKYDAIVGSGISILERVEIPADMLPPDSQVEIDAKIAAGYFSATAAHPPLDTVQGRVWDDIHH